ncbi:MAG: FAD:protein FMN transferase [Leptospiraceae bacterium]|nr:FAD:protein FMN transferase [Leptospiraceae bacterium]
MRQSIKPILTIAIFTFAFAHCSHKPLELHGSTMGTSYSVKVRDPGKVDSAALKEEIDSLLHSVDYRFSNWQKDELFRLNESNVGQVFRPSGDFCKVLAESQHLWQLTNGRFDPTIGELIDLWGFGPTERTGEPDDATIKAALGRAGFPSLGLKIDGSTCTIQKKSSLTLNLSAIAKGYGVDRVAQLLLQKGIRDFMVEIGGEVRTGPDGSFRIGIERPNYDGTRSLYAVLESRNQCIATSGNYRNFFKKDGYIHSHILDPFSGKPTPSRIQSATIVGPNCLTADGLATAAMLSTPEETAEVLKQMKGNYEYLILESGTLKDEDTNFEVQEYSSPGIQSMRVPL